MRYVIFSDIHGNGLAFDSFVDHLGAIVYDRAVCLGDFIGYYYDSARIIDYCAYHKILCLLGNHDSYFLRAMDGDLGFDTLVAKYGHSYILARDTLSAAAVSFLRSLRPSFYVSEPGGKNILFCHGSPLDPLEGRVYPDSDLNAFVTTVAGLDYVVCGHTHHKMVRRTGETLFLNPGSLGQQRDGRGCSYLVLDTASGEHGFNVVTYDIAQLERRIDALDGGNERFKAVLRRRR